MSRPEFEVADIFRRHGESYRQANAGHLDRCQCRVMAAIEACRTAALGGHVTRAGSVGTPRSPTAVAVIGIARSAKAPLHAHGWKRARPICLAVEYFHVVFTLPQPIAAIAYQNKARRLRHAVPRQPPRPCAPSPPIPSTWAPRSASSPCCTPGARTCSIIRICIASCRAAGCLPTAALDRLPARVLPARARPVTPVPAIVPGTS